MDIHNLSFAKIIVLQDDIAEVIVHEDIEMNLQMVDEYHAFLLSHLRAPFSLLVNKINAYTYDFEAQQKLATLDEINKMAVVAYNHRTEVATEYLTTVQREVDWNMKIFSDRDLAFKWLVAEQEKLNGQVKTA